MKRTHRSFGIAATAAAVIALFTVAGVFFACGDGGGGGGTGDDDGKNGNNGGNSNATVYVSGFWFGKQLGGKPCYWVDGVRKDLPMPTGSDPNVLVPPGGIAVQDGKVYVLGYTFDHSDYSDHLDPFFTYYYWVDGVIKDLTVGAHATNIAVQDGKVYVSGYYDYVEEITENSFRHFTIPCYWINGEKADLQVPFPEAVATGIAVQGGNIYVCGNMIDEDQRFFIDVVYEYFESPAFYLVNGNITYLSVPKGSQVYTSGIAVYDGKVYVCGSYDYNDNYNPCYWVDGKRVDLPYLSVPFPEAVATGIAVQGGKVYVCVYYGSGEDPNDNPCYWVDGKRVDLPTPSGTGGVATGIAVVSQ